MPERLDDAEYLLRSLRGLWSFHIGSGQYTAAMALAQRFCTLAANRSDPDDPLIGKRLIGIAQHYLGDQNSARRHLDRVFADDVIPGRRHVIRFQIDPQVAARVFLTRILWLQGFPDQAMRTAERSAEGARADDHAPSLCYILGHGAFPVALFVGDLAAAEHYAGMLLDHSTRHSLARCRAYGRRHQGALAIKRGDLNAGLRLLRAGFDELGGSKPALRVNALLMAEALSHAGQTADGLAAVEEALAWAESTGERWAIFEVLRLKSELVLLQGAPGAAASAEDCFRQALDWAHRQGALSWELRAAMSLARLLRDQHRSAASRALLEAVYNRFTEGFETPDLKAAKELLDVLE